MPPESESDADVDAGAEYVAAVDQGTSGTTGLIVDRDGTCRGRASAAHETATPRPDWAEQDPTTLWTNTRTVLRAALADAGIDGTALAALGITNQRETTVVWEAASGVPVYDAIVWQDQRTTERLASLDDALREHARERTGLEPDPYLSAGKVEWILEHADEAGGHDHDHDRGYGDGTTGRSLRERAADGELLFGTVDSWLLYKLTGAHATDVTNAAHTMLFDIHDRTWDDRLLEAFGVPRAMLPTVAPSSSAEPFGVTDPDGVLGAAVPVTGMAGDQQAALVGQAGFEQGELKHTMGTTSISILNLGTTPPDDAGEHGLNVTIGYQLGDRPPVYAAEGMSWVGGQSLEWLVDLGVFERAEQTERLAADVDAAETADLHVVPAFNGLGTPYWAPEATGTILGLKPGTGRDHLARATLEAVAHRARDIVDAMRADYDVEVATLRVDGGLATNDVLCQLLADVMTTTVERPAITETTALGAAFLAGLAVAYWPDTDAVRACRTVDRRFTPAIDAASADERHRAWRAAVETAID